MIKEEKKSLLTVILPDYRIWLYYGLAVIPTLASWWQMWAVTMPPHLKVKPLTINLKDAQWGKDSVLSVPTMF